MSFNETVELTGPLIQTVNHLELHARLTCLGITDLDCDKWDHILAVGAHCVRADGIAEEVGAPGELGRWITPYARRAGEWLTPATPLLALLGDGKSPMNCTFKLSAVDNGSPWVFSLSLRGTHVQDQPRPSRLFELFNNSGHSVFDASYNKRPAIPVVAPFAAPKIVLTAYITGHGDMEFVPSQHTFTVNGHAFTISFLEPLNQIGCAKQVISGVSANGHGAWWYGRDGWCNGDAVSPVSFDVSAAVNKASRFDVAYSAAQYNVTTSSWQEPQSPGGYISLSSRIVFYQ